MGCVDDQTKLQVFDWFVKSFDWFLVKVESLTRPTQRAAQVLSFDRHDVQVEGIRASKKARLTMSLDASCTLAQKCAEILFRLK